ERIDAESARVNPRRSLDSITTTWSDESFRTIALARKSCCLPSAGFVRAAYPAIHIGSCGVMTTCATPASHPFPNREMGSSMLVNREQSSLIWLFIVMLVRRRLYRI